MLAKKGDFATHNTAIRNSSKIKEFCRSQPFTCCKLCVHKIGMIMIQCTCRDRCLVKNDPVRLCARTRLHIAFHKGECPDSRWKRSWAHSLIHTGNGTIVQDE